MATLRVSVCRVARLRWEDSSPPESLGQEVPSEGGGGAEEVGGKVGCGGGGLEREREI